MINTPRALTGNCEYPDCSKTSVALVVDMENNWWEWCTEHAIADLTESRERGA